MRQEKCDERRETGAHEPCCDCHNRCACIAILDGQAVVDQAAGLAEGQTEKGEPNQHVRRLAHGPGVQELRGKPAIGANHHSRDRQEGAPSDPGGPDATNVAAATVLRMATLGGAIALGIDDHTGSIEVGKLADLVAVDLSDPSTEPVRDPVAAVVYGASRSQVRSVWVAGERVVREGRCVNVDERDVVAALRRLGDEFRPD